MDGRQVCVNSRQLCWAQQELMILTVAQLRTHHVARLCALPILFLLCFATIQAEPAETIINNGPAANRVDVAIVGDGYTASETTKYRTDVLQLLQAMFASGGWAGAEFWPMMPDA